MRGVPAGGEIHEGNGSRPYKGTSRRPAIVLGHEQLATTM